MMHYGNHGIVQMFPDYGWNPKRPGPCGLNTRQRRNLRRRERQSTLHVVGKWIVMTTAVSVPSDTMTIEARMFV